MKVILFILCLLGLLFGDIKDYIMKYPVPPDELIKIIRRDNKQVKLAAVKKLGKDKAQKGIEILTKILLFEFDKTVYTGQHPEALDGDVRAAAAISLAQIGNLKSIDIIGRTLYNTKDIKVGIACAKALGMLKSGSGVRYLIDTLEKYTEDIKIDMDLALAIVTAMGDIGHKNAFFALVSVTQGDYSPEVKNAALAALEKINWTESKEIKIYSGSYHHD